MKNLSNIAKNSIMTLALLATYSCEGIFGKNDTSEESLFPDASLNQPIPDFGDEDITVDNIPSSIFSVNVYNNKIIDFNMSGIQSPNGDDFVILKGTGNENQNVWLEIDDELIGFATLNGSEIATGTTLAEADLVFLIDNSGTMTAEADAVAAQVIEWGNELASVMDIRFACIGYDEKGINGAVDFTDVAMFSDYLNYSTGVARTQHFSASISTEAVADAENFTTDEECGVAAVLYATKHLSYRSTANRIYVNLTDEANQPGTSNPQWSVEIFNDESSLYNWSASSGTIHTVWSGFAYFDGNHTWTPYTDEDPTLMSTYTGGTMVSDASMDYSNVTLSDLPVTGSILNSFELNFDYKEALKTGEHELRITIVDPETNIILRNTIPIEIAE